MGISLTGGLIPIVIFIARARLYSVSMWHELMDDEMSWKRGVWFCRTGIVPYDHITTLI